MSTLQQTSLSPAYDTYHPPTMITPTGLPDTTSTIDVSVVNTTLLLASVLSVCHRFPHKRCPPMCYVSDIIPSHKPQCYSCTTVCSVEDERCGIYCGGDAPVPLNGSSLRAAIEDRQLHCRMYQPPCPHWCHVNSSRDSRCEPCADVCGRWNATKELCEEKCGPGSFPWSQFLDAVQAAQISCPTSCQSIEESDQLVTVVVSACAAVAVVIGGVIIWFCCCRGRCEDYQQPRDQQTEPTVSDEPEAGCSLEMREANLGDERKAEPIEIPPEGDLFGKHKHSYMERIQGIPLTPKTLPKLTQLSPKDTLKTIPSTIETVPRTRSTSGKLVSEIHEMGSPLNRKANPGVERRAEPIKTPSKGSADADLFEDYRHSNKDVLHGMPPIPMKTLRTLPPSPKLGVKAVESSNKRSLRSRSLSGRQVVRTVPVSPTAAPRTPLHGYSPQSTPRSRRFPRTVPSYPNTPHAVRRRSVPLNLEPQSSPRLSVLGRSMTRSDSRIDIHTPNHMRHHHDSTPKQETVCPDSSLAIYKKSQTSLSCQASDREQSDENNKDARNASASVKGTAAA